MLRDLIRCGLLHYWAMLVWVRFVDRGCILRLVLGPAKLDNLGGTPWRMKNR